MKLSKINVELPKHNSKLLIPEDIAKYFADTKLPEPTHYYEFTSEEIKELNKTLTKIKSDYIQRAIKSKKAAEGFIFNV